MLRVLKIPGEATRYHVESNTLECVLNRRHQFSRLRKRGIYIGGPCPKEGCPGTLDCRFHQVDISMYNLNGWCSCEYFAFGLEPKVSRMGPAEQGAGNHRCAHINAARDFALDVSLKAHERERYARARGQREEVQP